MKTSFMLVFSTMISIGFSILLFSSSVIAWDSHSYTPDWLNTIEPSQTPDSYTPPCDSGIGDNEGGVVYCVQPGATKFETDCELDGNVGDTESWVCPPRANLSLEKTRLS